MSAPIDDGEQAVRDRLIALIDGPTADAQPNAVDAAAAAAIAQPRIPVQPQPQDVQPDADAADTEADEFDEYDEEDAQPADEEDAQPQKRRVQVRIPRIRPRGPVPVSGSIVAAPAPRMSLLDAYGNIPPRIRWLGVHVSAAAFGYHYGWVQYSTRYSAWLDQHGWNNLNGYFWIGCAIGCELLRRRTRHSVLLLRWVFAVPITSIVTGTLLYGAGWQNLELPL